MKNIINFPVNCSKCTKYPIQNILYKCYECSLFFCENCESIEGPIHLHPLLKIRTNEQFQKWNSVENNTSSSIIEVIGNMKDSVLGGIKSISDFFTGENNVINNNDLNNNFNNNFINNYNNNNNLNNNNFNHNNFNNNYNNFNNTFNNINNNNFNQKINENPEIINNIMNEKINERNNSNISQQIKYLKSLYDLSQIPDIKIEEAIKKANGNLDEVTTYLFP